VQFWHCSSKRGQEGSSSVPAMTGRLSWGRDDGGVPRDVRGEGTQGWCIVPSTPPAGYSTLPCSSAACREEVSAPLDAGRRSLLFLMPGGGLFSPWCAGRSLFTVMCREVSLPVRDAGRRSLCLFGMPEGGLLLASGL